MMIITLLTYLITIISIALLLFKLKTYGFNLLRFNFLIFILISLIPFCLLYGEHHNWELNSYYMFRIVFALILCLLVFIDKSKIKYKGHFPVDIQITYFIGTISVLISVIYIFLIGPSNFPLFNLLHSSYAELVLMREDAFKLADIPVMFSYVVFYNKYLFIPLFCAAILIFWNSINKMFVTVVLFVMIINQLLTMSKTALFLMVLSILLSYLFQKGFSIRKMFFAGLILLFVPLSILYAIESDRDVVFTALALFNRLFLIPETSALEYYSLFVNGQFTSITSSFLFSVFNHKDVVNVQNFVFLQMNPGAVLQEGTAPGNIFGIAFVDIREFLIGGYYIIILVSIRKPQLHEI